MNNLKGYATYNIFFENNPNKIKNIKLSENVFLDYRIDPSYTRWRNKDGTMLHERMELPSSDEISELMKEYDPAYQLIIFAENDLIAQNVSNLIHGARLLCYPCLYEHPNTNSIYNLEYKGFEEVYKKVKYTEDMLLACEIVEKIWGNQSLIYSIEKYRFSLNLDSITPHSAAPRFGQIFSIEDRGNDYHVNAAYAMFSAYSIIEELGLDIRSSSKNQRFLGDEWNPNVENNIVERLGNIGIMKSDIMEWVIRGEYTDLYKGIKPQLGKESRYNDGVLNFDRELKIYDAIHYASFIRNYFIGHKFDEIVKFINPYDVFNFQMLVRRLILSKIDMWKRL